MKGLENQLYTMMLILSNLVAILQLVTAVFWPRVARISFVLLFAWASWMNWRTVTSTPLAYLEYADFAWIKWYRDFINGWFSNNIIWVVGFIATCQGLIALSLVFKGLTYRAGSYAAILFFLSILPLGVGAGFPCTFIMSVSIFILLQKEHRRLLWETRYPAVGHPAGEVAGS